MCLIYKIISISDGWYLIIHYFILFLLIITGYYIYRTHFWQSLREILIFRRINTALQIQIPQICFRCLRNQNRTLKFINQRVVTHFGYEARELLNDSTLSFNALIHPDDRLNVSQSIERSLATENNYQVEYRVLTKWGGIRWIFEQGTILLKNKKQGKIIEGILTDVTDKRYMKDTINESENRFHTFIEHVPVGICIIYNEMITYANPVFLAMFKLLNDEEVLGIAPHKFIVPENRDEFDQFIHKRYPQDSRQSELIIYGLCANGVQFPMHAILAQLTGGEFEGKLLFLFDITAMKSKEEALQISEKMARTIVETTEDYMLLVKADRTIMDCNSKIASRFNYTREEMIGVNLNNLLAADRFNFWNEKFIQVIASGKSVIFEHHTTDGNAYYMVSIYPVKNEANEIISFVMYGHNYTQLKHAETALKESEVQYRSITESITDYVYKIQVMEETPWIIFNCSGCERIIGYTIAEFAQNPNFLLSIIVPEDKKLFLAQLEICIAQKTSRTFEHRIIHKNGKTIWVSNSIIYFRETGNNNSEFNGVIKDITLNKQTEFALLEIEKRYRTVFDQSGMATSVFDLNGKLIMQNSLAASLLGGTPPNFVGKNIDEIAMPHLAKGIRIAINKALKAETIFHESEVALPTGKYWLKSTGHTIKNSNGEDVGVQFISQNITDKKEYEREMLNTIIATEEKERIHFAQELHDGLGPLLSAIKIYTQWLSRPDAIIQQAEVLVDMENLVNEASATIKEISFKLSPHILDNFGLIDAIKDYAEKLNRSKMIDIDIVGTIMQPLEKTVESTLYRILCECINNTVKHARANNITIKLQKFQKKMKISYADNGVGFDMDNVLNAKSGNGLFNMQNRIESINGYIVFNSGNGKGTKILIVVRI